MARLRLKSAAALKRLVQRSKSVARKRAKRPLYPLIHNSPAELRTASDGSIELIIPVASAIDFDELRDAHIVVPITDHERWISLYLSGSRGFSHEQVRHGDFTAISQRSTRFVDESESAWIQHPLISKYLDDVHADETVIPYAEDQVLIAARKAYQFAVQELEPYLLDQGVEKTSARKQARGAARGYLGNALQTEMIFSANVAQWKRMLRQRATIFADAEIRVVYCEALRELKASAYASRFDNWALQKSPDGIGQVAVETAN